jgi:hypothetical protein
MNAFDDFREAVLNEAGNLARDFLKGNVAEARTVAGAFVDQSRAKLEKWTRQRLDGKLTRDEFNDLVRGEADLAKINALTQAGIAVGKAEQFRKKLTNVVLDKAIGILL